jgi:hypothetical protein
MQQALDALVLVGARKAANDFDLVLRGLGVPVRASSQDARWDLLEEHWPEAFGCT